MLLDDEPGPTLRGQPLEPGRQQLVQRDLADADRRVRPDRIDHKISGHVVGAHDADIRAAVDQSVLDAEVTRSPIDVDRPDHSVGGSEGERDRNGPVAAAEIDEVRGSGRGSRHGRQQDLRPGVDVLGREHPPVGDERRREIGEIEPHRAARRADGGLSGEVLLGTHRRTVAGLVGPIDVGGNIKSMASRHIRIVGDPVLRKRAEEVTDITTDLVTLVDDMFETMYEAPGLGLAAPQVGVQSRFFVFDVDDDPRVLINPTITGTDGEWYFDEGCLSIPGQYFEICRPKQIEVSGIDLDGNDVVFEADELLARLVQHELDHLNGVLLLDHLDPDEAKAAKRAVREMQMAAAGMSDEEAARAAAEAVDRADAGGPRRRFSLRNR